uniref:Uncharacterized protein n=1 Tax=Strigamia maritima TaxID=126957 RepID=T1IU10_STRMM
MKIANFLSFLAINGYTYGNLPGLKMVEKETISWHITSAGYAKGDMHVPFFHGNTFQTDGTRKDTFPLIPDLFKTLLMEPDNPGKWLIEDMIHIYSNEKGMTAFYTVEKSHFHQDTTKVKKVKLAHITSQLFSAPYFVQGDHTIGHIYIKAVYREFTDKTFKTQKRRTDREHHLGLLGPFIKAEVGDTIKVHFKNFARFNFSLQPHGVFYNQSNKERNNTGDSVEPGQTNVYEWSVPARAGPSYDDFQCIFWPYMSSVNEFSDMHAGLLGSIVICRIGTLDRKNRRRDVDREFTLFYNIYNENASPYIDTNIMKYTKKPEETLGLRSNLDFIESNTMMAINGYSFASIRHVDLFLGETAAFYLVSLGNPHEVHTVHWHGNTFVRRQTGLHRHDVIDVIPGDFSQVELLGVNVGEWIMHCHVGNHSENGMLMTYRVLDPDVYFRTPDIHPHGVFNNKDSEGTVNKVQYNLCGPDIVGAQNSVRSGQVSGRHKYFSMAGDWLGSAIVSGLDRCPVGTVSRPHRIWTKRRRADPNCISWLYHSHNLAEIEVNTEVVGILVICKKGILDHKGNRYNVDKEFSLLFAIIDEALSQHRQANIEAQGITEKDLQHDFTSFQFSTFQHPISMILRIFTLLLVTIIQRCFTIERVYYIAAVKEQWDYAPKGNLIYSGNPKDTDLFLKLDPSIPTPGTKYQKTLFRQFTDETFTKRVKMPEWQGMIGPFMKAEIGDTLVVHFQNQAEFLYSIHPHGVFYNKNSEGAFYADGTSGKDKLDDGVKPGDNYTYIWSVTPDYGPTDNDPNCLSWIYHSHHFAEVEVMTGAVGILATCKQGILDEKGNRADINKEFALLFSIMDENFSQYKKENVEAAGITEEAIRNNFLPFQYGNRKHTINGYIYGNLPGLDVCLGDKINFHIAAVGNDFDIHSVYVQGQTMEIYRHNVDTVGMYAGSSLTASINAENVGKWLLSSQGMDYIKAGMQAFFNVKNCYHNELETNNSKHYNHPQPTGRTRTFYIAAEEIMWNYAPSGIDQESGYPLSEYVVHNVSLVYEVAPESYGRSLDMCHFNGTYKKAVYRGYTDASYRIRLPRPSWHQHLGYLGPLIEAEVGDRIKINFLNRASRPYSIHAFRFFVPDNQQGIQYKDGPNVAVQPNTQREYTWTVTNSVGPSRDDPDCLSGRYYSAVDQVKDSFTGLNGPFLICKKGVLTNPHKKVDRNFYLLFSNVLETESHYWSDNVKRVCGKDVDPDKMSKNFTYWEASNIRSINGFTYGNLPGLNMIEHEKIVWYVTSAGFAKGDMHVPFFHGNTFYTDGQRKDTFPLIPDLFKTLEMTPDNPGKWLIEDLLYIYSNGRGMSALYTVKKGRQVNNTKKENKGKLRIYYIAAVEEEWDYYPNITVQPISGLPLDKDPFSSQYYVQGNNTIGHIYIKAMYREFTDATFSKQKIRSEGELHLGTLGPFIKAEIGDTIRVVFKNKAKFPFSIQPHGVFYNKSNEGNGYNDGTSGQDKKDDAVEPGQIQIYEWAVPERAGPSYDNFPCVFWPYMSAVDEYGDFEAGLVGPIVICRRGILNENDRRTDVNREFVLFYNINNENASPYLIENIKKYTNNPDETLLMQTTAAWVETNMMMGINGYSFGSIKNVEMYLGESAAFYLLGLGDAFQTHTVHFHGNTFIRRLTGPHRHDVMDILPGDFDQVKIIGVNVVPISMTVRNLILVSFVHSCLAIERVYYIAAVKEQWDYAPQGNLIRSGTPEISNLFLKLDPSIPTTGTKFLKTLFRQYTDETFTKRVKAPEWQGMIGPFMKAEVGDTLVIFFQNQAEFVYSIHSHGVFYNKDSEGAMYADGTSRKLTKGDSIKPGDNYTYIWSIPSSYGPTDNDPKCLTWLYHSHHIAEIEVMTGAVGILSTCKPGTLDDKGNRKDVDKEFALLFSIMDENFSQYKKENLKTAGITEKAIRNNFVPFAQANQKHSINGYIYGNLKGLDVCLGDKISLHMAAIGNEFEMHSVYLQGQTMEIYQHITDTVGIYSGSSITATIHAENEGKWLLSSQGREYITGNYDSNLKTVQKLKDLPECADDSFGPSDSDLCRFNGTYKKAIYRGYTDGSFKKQLARPTSEEHLGFLGPPIEAEVGDTIKVHFLNRASKPYSIQAYRYFIANNQQGIQYKDGPIVAVQPNEQREYIWTVPPLVGPATNDADCLFGSYYSAVHQVRDTFSGLHGPLLICKKGTLTNQTRKADKSFYLLFSNVQETESHYWKENVQRVCGKDVDPDEMIKNDVYWDANIMRSINGYTYGNLPGLDMVQREKIMWYITSAGNAVEDIHVPYFHGNTFLTDGQRRDTFSLIPDLFKTLEMTPDNPGSNHGKWLIEDLLYIYSNEKGMTALYTVKNALSSKQSTKEKTGKLRTYYIAAVEQEWNYYPNITHNLITGLPLNEDPTSALFYVQSDTTIGHIYIKAMFREFTDETLVQKNQIGTRASFRHVGTNYKSRTGCPGGIDSGLESVHRDLSRLLARIVTPGLGRPDTPGSVAGSWNAGVETTGLVRQGGDAGVCHAKELVSCQCRTSALFYVQSDTTIGHIYIKAMFREFTDETFSTEKIRSEHEHHLGTLGPIIKAEVGDTIRVIFKNKARFNFSIQPHGVFYNKSNEAGCPGGIDSGLESVHRDLSRLLARIVTPGLVCPD